MNTTYLIVGAGLSGSTCAYLLKRAGADVVLVESRDVRKKDKLCAGLLTPRAIEALDRIYGFGVHSVFRDSFSQMRCLTDDIEINVANVNVKSVRRHELDDFALQAYLDLGGVLVDRLSIRDIDFDHKHVEGFRDKTEAFACNYEKLIGADGALSMVREAACGKKPDSVLSLEADVEHRGAPFTMAYKTGFFGYSWYAPSGDRAKIGCASFKPGQDLDAMLSEFAAYIGVEYGKRRGAFIPTGSDVCLQKGDVYFLGDAASLICPPSGEGIYYALRSAEQLFRALVSNSSYKALMAKQVARIEREYMTRDVFFNRRFIRTGIFAASATPYGKERAVKFALKHFVSFE